MGKENFLEYLAQEAGCDCLSDLRLRQDKWSTVITEILEKTGCNDIQLNEWREVISYLTDTELKQLKEIKTNEQAKKFIINWLISKKD